MCLLRSSVILLYHWMIYCILSPTKIVSQRSVCLCGMYYVAHVCVCVWVRACTYLYHHASNYVHVLCVSLCVTMFVTVYVTVCVTMFATVYVTVCITLLLYMSLCVCYAQVKNVYVQFLMHAYIDTDVEMKEVYSRDTMWELFDNFLPDISTVSNVLKLYYDNPSRVLCLMLQCIFLIR